MQRKKLFTPILLSIFTIAAIFIFRNSILNWMQRQILGRIRDRAVLSNAVFRRPGNNHERHQIYSLKGLDRIWPHRVNSMQRLRYLYPNFAGFECDIRFDAVSGQCWIAHDPQEISPLVFEDFLARADGAHKLFWLDVKNLDSLNREAFCLELERLDRKYQLKNRIILESPDTSALHSISQSGWFCSLYLPADFPANPVEQKDWVAAVTAFLKKNAVLISQDVRLQYSMAKNFPPFKQLIWDIRFKDGMNKDLLLREANDTTVLVWLINVKSPGYR